MKDKKTQEENAAEQNVAVNNGSDVPQTVSAPNATPARQLTFHIVDSAMGAGKSESLLDRARFNGGWGYIRYPEEVERLRRNGWKGEFKGERCIIFVSTKKERDERFVKELNMGSWIRNDLKKGFVNLRHFSSNHIKLQTKFDKWIFVNSFLGKSLAFSNVLG